MYDWREFALCVGADPEIWFPAAEPGSVGFERLAGQARAICADCPVRASCVEWALEIGVDDGIFGGLDPAERRALSRERQAA